MEEVDIYGGFGSDEKGSADQPPSMNGEKKPKVSSSTPSATAHSASPAVGVQNSSYTAPIVVDPIPFYPVGAGGGDCGSGSVCAPEVR